jgi:hypothetical protein
MADEEISQLTAYTTEHDDDHLLLEGSVVSSVPITLNPYATTIVSDSGSLALNPYATITIEDEGTPALNPYATIMVPPGAGE